MSTHYRYSARIYGAEARMQAGALPQRIPYKCQPKLASFRRPRNHTTATTNVHSGFYCYIIPKIIMNLNKQTIQFHSSFNQFTKLLIKLSILHNPSFSIYNMSRDLPLPLPVRKACCHSFCTAPQRLEQKVKVEWDTV